VGKVGFTFIKEESQMNNVTIKVCFSGTVGGRILVSFPDMQGCPRLSFTPRASMGNAYRFDGSILKEGGPITEGEKLRLLELAELALRQNGRDVAATTSISFKTA
jgi:hypothetical protein